MKTSLINVPSGPAHSGRVEQSVSARQVLHHMKVGQLVDAFVLSNDQQRHIKLRIGNTVLTAAANVNVPKNTHLLLRVVQLRPQLLLQLLPSTSEHDALKTLQQTAISLLPKQDGLAPSLAGLLNKAIINSKAREFHAIRSLIQSLSKTIPQRQAISHTEGLRQAILNSGLFLEAILSRTGKHKKSNTSKDLKVALLRLKQALERANAPGGTAVTAHSPVASPLANSVFPPTKSGLPLPQARAPVALAPETDAIADILSEVRVRTRSALSRLGLLQVYSAENFNNGENCWHVELPVQHNNTIEIVSIKIKKEHHNGTDNKNVSWTIVFSVDLPVLGAIEIRVSVFDEGVSSCFRSASSATAELINSRFERLRSSLENQGIRVINLNCHNGLAGISHPDSAESTMDITA